MYIKTQLSKEYIYRSKQYAAIQLDQKEAMNKGTNVVLFDCLFVTVYMC